jgi:hypothetical protein
LTESPDVWNKCSTCDVDCKLKEKQGNLAPKELKKAPESCPYVVEEKKIANAVLEQLSETINRSSRAFVEIARQAREQIQVPNLLPQINEYYRLQEVIAKSLKDLLVPKITFNQLEPIIRQITETSRYLSTIPETYYLPQDFEVIRGPLILPKEKTPLELIERLSRCRRGHKFWQQFQNLSRDILAYLFVPPLGEPMEESTTETGLQRRDLIFPISYDTDGFWMMIKYKHDAEALIVECKNHSEPIGANEIVKASKYLGKKRLGMFALVISRYPPEQSAIKEMKRLWRDEEKLVLCLDDDDLKTMIHLKENGKDPELLIEKRRFELLQSLE